MSDYSIEIFQDEISSLKDECHSLIDEYAKSLNLPNNRSTVALIPVLYSVWERAFRGGFAICFKLIASHYKTVNQLPPNNQAIWFRKSEPFKHYTGYLGEFFKLIFETFSDGDRSVSKNLSKPSLFQRSKKLLTAFQSWSGDKLISSKASDYVFIPSNANHSVIEINAEAIGLKIESIFSTDKNDSGKIFKGDLDKFIGLRNDICHGDNSLLLKAIPPRELADYIEFIKELVEKFLSLILEWILEFEVSNQDKSDSDIG